MNLFDGLKSYEAVLMVLGILLFVVSLVGLVLRLVRQGEVAKLVPLFLVSVAMIGYPSVKKIQYGDFLVELEQQTEETQNNPGDPQIRRALDRKLSRLDMDRVRSTDALVTVARAQLATDDTAKARVTIDRAIQKSPTRTDVQALRRRLDSP